MSVTVNDFNDTESKCLVCKEDASGTGVAVNSVRTTASNVLLAFKLFDVCGIQSWGGLVCGLCHDLVNEVDGYEVNLKASKNEIMERMKGDRSEVVPSNKRRKKVVDAVKVKVEDEEEVYESVVEAAGGQSKGDFPSLIEEGQDDDEDDDEDYEYDVDDDWNPLEDDEAEKPPPMKRRRSSANNKRTPKAQQQQQQSQQQQLLPVDPFDYDKFKLSVPDDFIPDEEIPPSKLDVSQCPFCPLKFSRWKEKMTHFVDTHLTVREPFRCPKCPDAVALSRLQIWEHARDVHGYQNGSGNDDDGIFSRGGMFLDRTELNSREGDYFNTFALDDERSQCRLCGLICLRSEPLAARFHAKIHHKDKFLYHKKKDQNCPFCDEKCNALHSLRTHIMQSHLGISPNRVGPWNKPYYFDDVDDPDVVKLFGGEAKHFGRNVERYLARSVKSGSKTKSRIPDELILELEKQVDFLKGLPAVILSDGEWIGFELSRLKSQCKEDLPVENIAHCFLCNVGFANEGEALRHRLALHEENRMSCGLCGVAFESQEQISAHAEKDHGEVLEDSSRMRAALRDSSSSGLTGGFQCPKCVTVNSRELGHYSHLYSAHAHGRRCVIPFCKLPVKDHANRMQYHQFVAHCLVYHADYAFECPKCKKQMNAANHLKEHLNDHVALAGSGKLDHYKCDMCDFTSSRSSIIMARHKFKAHGVDNIEVQCVKCKESFANLKIYDEHNEQVHKKPCPICGVLTDDSRHFERMHTEERAKVICDICSKAVVNLDSHMRWTHSDVQYTCKHCGKSYKGKTSLSYHIKVTHTANPKKFPCNVCGKLFSDNSNLKQHSYTHTDNKPFRCEYCGKGFGRRDFWRSHTTKCVAQQPQVVHHQPQQHLQQPMQH